MAWVAKTQFVIFMYQILTFKADIFIPDRRSADNKMLKKKKKPKATICLN